MYSYATYKQLEDQLEVTDNPITAANQVKVMSYARRATAFIERITTQEYAPEWVTRGYKAYPRDNINSRYNTLRLYAPTLEIDSISIGDLAIASDEYRLEPVGSRYPFNEVYRLRAFGSWQAGAGRDDLITVTALEGYRTRYASDAWHPSGDAAIDALSPTTATISVTDVDGVDGLGETPRFSPGMLIRIADEYMIVTGVDTTLNTLRVLRGQRGTTAASHDAGSTIDVWSVEPEIVRACMLIASFNINNIGNMTRVTFDGVQATERMEIPDEANMILNLFKPKHRVKGF